MKVLPLACLKPGEKGIVRFIDAGRGASRRLLDLGITPGQEVEIVRSVPFHGPIRVRVRGSDMAIGRGIAMKVFVTTNMEDHEGNESP